MQRAELLAKLELVTPALATPDTPIMSHYWFTGSHVTAYNDQISIRTPLATDFNGAAPRHIAAILAASNAVNTTLEPEGENLKMKLAGGTFRLPLLPAERFESLFDFPQSTTVALDSNDREVLLSAFECCAMSMSNDISRPEYLGITMLPSNRGLAMYTTDGKRMTYVHLKNNKYLAERTVIVPKLFCEQAVDFMRSATEVEFGIHDDHVLLLADDVELFGRLVSCEQPLNFSEVFNERFPQNRRNDLIDIPPLLGNVLKRSSIIYSSGLEPCAEFSVRRNEFVLETKTRTSDGKDTLKFDHPDTKVVTDPKLIHEGVDRFKKLLFTETCVIMANPEAQQYYIVASLS